MEGKDLITIVLSVAAIFISILAWRTANAGFRLAQAQDQRAVDREKPLVELDMPTYFGRGPLEIPYKVTNRSEEPIEIVGFRVPIHIGQTAITKRAPFRFADSEAAERVTAKPVDLETGDYQIIRIKRVLDPGSAYSGKIIFVPDVRDRVKAETELRFYMDVVVRNREATAYSLPVLRKV